MFVTLALFAPGAILVAVGTHDIIKAGKEKKYNNNKNKEYIKKYGENNYLNQETIVNSTGSSSYKINEDEKYDTDIKNNKESHDTQLGYFEEKKKREVIESHPLNHVLICNDGERYRKYGVLNYDKIIQENATDFIILDEVKNKIEKVIKNPEDLDENSDSYEEDKAAVYTCLHAPLSQNEINDKMQQIRNLQKEYKELEKLNRLQSSYEHYQSINRNQLNSKILLESKENLDSFANNLKTQVSSKNEALQKQQDEIQKNIQKKLEEVKNKVNESSRGGL